MKKIYLLTALALAMAACSTSEQQEVITGESLPSIEQGLKLNIVSATPTRADAIYEDGTPTENQIDRVRFYFFDADGNVAPAWENKGTGNNNYNSFIDWFPSATDQTTDDTPVNVEKVLSVTLSLSFPANLEEVQPAAVLAVLNPPQEVLNLTDSHTVQAGAAQITVNGPDLSTLQTTYSNYLTGMTSSGTFVMSNSVFVSAATEGQTGKEVIATIITKDNWEPDEEDAEQTPITIYVERVLARVDFSLNLSSTSNDPITLPNGKIIYKVGSYSVSDGTTSPGETDIYIDLLGWNATGTTSASRLVKMIDPSWTDAGVFGTNQGSALEPWNNPTYHRSFWAVNPPEDNFKYQFGNFNGQGSAPGLFATAQDMPSGTIYLQENANTYNNNNGIINPEPPAYATNIIMAAQLVDKEGNPYQMAEWNNYKYTLPQMKIRIASVLSNLYKRTTNAENETVYTSISPDDFTFATATSLGLEEENEAGYYVYPVLTEDAQAYTWTLGEGTDASPMTYQQVNTYMRDMVNHVMVWGNETNPGYTYYFVTIQHLGEEDSPGYWGVVRNHIYKVSITSIAGLGTPVYDPEETIYPEEVQSGNNVITAEIDILQWRVVNQTFDITWP